MIPFKFTDADRLQLQEAGISLEGAEKQLRLLREGMRFPHLIRPATEGDGIDILDPGTFTELGA